jgi:2-polyprenyl-3-methyl-5-hydroxy-6-metoxy-1,4-benzoquinol methylase
VNLYRVFYRLGIAPWERTPGPAMLDRVLADDVPAPGRRALDVGCGTGRDAIHLAKKGWQVTAVDLEERALQKARQRAAEEGAEVDWVLGDVTNLGALGTQPGYSLIYDMGCIQGLPDEAAKRAAQGITSLAAANATLLFLAFTRDRRMILPRGMDLDHIETLFGPAWQLTNTHDMLALSASKAPPPIRRARPTTYQLVKT